MSKAVVLQHVEYESPGRIATILRDYGIPVEIRRLYRGDEVPTNPEELRLLVVMGGPMGISDIPSGQFPFLEKEVALLKKMIEQDRAVLGMCLGAQFIAHAAGAKVYPNTKAGAGANKDQPPLPAPEIGWAPISYPFPGGTEPLVYGMHDGMMMFHWHFDTFDLPKLPLPANTPPSPPAPAPPTGNVLLASSRTCKNQAFRFKTRLLGFQYHFEMTPEAIEEMLTHGKETVEKVLGPGGVEQIRNDTRKHYDAYRRLGDRMIGNVVDFLKLA